MTSLPSNLDLLKLRAAGETSEKIAKEFGVSIQAVNKRFNSMGIYVRGPRSDALSPRQADRRTTVTAQLPWDISTLPAVTRKKFAAQESFKGLRGYIGKRLGQPLNERTQIALRRFLMHVESGEVLNFDESKGFHYAPRIAADGALVVRWPHGEPAPTAEQVALFSLPEGHVRSCSAVAPRT